MGKGLLVYIPVRLEKNSWTLASMSAINTDSERQIANSETTNPLRYHLLQSTRLFHMTDDSEKYGEKVSTAGVPGVETKYLRYAPESQRSQLSEAIRAALGLR